MTPYQRWAVMRITAYQFNFATMGRCGLETSVARESPATHVGPSPPKPDRRWRWLFRQPPWGGRPGGAQGSSFHQPAAAAKCPYGRRSALDMIDRRKLQYFCRSVSFHYLKGAQPEGPGLRLGQHSRFGPTERRTSRRRRWPHRSRHWPRPSFDEREQRGGRGAIRPDPAGTCTKPGLGITRMGAGAPGTGADGMAQNQAGGKGAGATPGTYGTPGGKGRGIAISQPAAVAGSLGHGSGTPASGVCRLAPAGNGQRRNQPTHVRPKEILDHKPETNHGMVQMRRPVAIKGPVAPRRSKATSAK